jgi:hypothetical protein
MLLEEYADCRENNNWIICFSFFCAQNMVNPTKIVQLATIETTVKRKN